MVEFLSAPVAALAVLGLFVHRSITQVTEEVEVLVFLRTLFLTLRVFFQIGNKISIFHFLTIRMSMT